MDDGLNVDLDSFALEALSERAQAHGRSPEEEAADIIRKQLQRDRGPEYMIEWSRRIRAMSPPGPQKTDSLKLLREDRDR
jgi:plasmid stability protein